MSYQLADGKFQFSADLTVPYNVFWYSKKWQRNNFERITSQFTHVIWEAGIPMFGDLYERDLAAEVSAVRERGLGVAMLSHGSELRSPDMHAANNHWSPFADNASAVVERLRGRVARTKRLYSAVSAPVFVTTPDLISDWPEARWVPLTINAKIWKNSEPPLCEKRIRIVHAPTNAWVKGSDLIEPALLKLQDEGIIQYTRVQNVPSARMPEVYRDADVVLDQFLVGSYGVTAVEALASGRIVLGHVREDVREYVKSYSGIELPIVQTTVDDIEQVIRAISKEMDAYRELAARGPAFVDVVHDGQLATKALRSFLEG